MSLWMIVLAGGRGERVRSEVNKVYLPIADREMIEYPLETFERSPLVDGIVVVARPGDTSHLQRLLDDLPGPVETLVVAGGPTRHQSERSGIEALADGIDSGAVEWVAVHDGARPFVTLDLLSALVEEARRRGGAVPALPVPAPLYQRQGIDVVPLQTDSLRRAQTPQVFRAPDLLSAYRQAEEAGVEGMDTAETVERFTDLEVGLVAGDPRNIKVTFVEDLIEAEDHARLFRAGRWTDSP